ncbi:MAG TPA: sugar ABC transporter substrate-binding protein [Streptosporangiaceae bacterium]|jgi:multiple sugar transport system substrate-binding protein
MHSPGPRRTIGLTLAGVTVSLLAAGCVGAGGGGGSTASSGSSSSKITPAVPKSGQITLTEYDYYTTPGGITAMQDVIKAFEAKYPNVTIKRQEVPYPSVDKLVTLEEAGNTPNIVIEDQDYLDQYYPGLVPLTTFFSNSFINQFLPGGTQSVMLNGNKYGLQIFGGNDTALIYNKTDFAAAGIKAPPKTWDELLADAKKLTVPAKNRYGFEIAGSQAENSTWQLEPFVWSSGGDLSKPTTAAWNQSMSLWNEMVKKGYMPSAVTGWDQTAEENHFEDNNVAMEINGPWNVPLLQSSKLNWGVAPIPVQQSGQTLQVPVGGEGWTIGKSTKTKEAASAAFLQFAAQDRSLNLKAVNSVGYLPSIKSEISGYSARYPAYSVFADEFQHGRARVYGNNYGQVSAAIQLMIGNVLSGKASVSQGLSTLSTTVSHIKK